MKKVIVIVLCIIEMMNANNFGYSWDDREIKSKQGFKFSYKESNNYAYFVREKKRNLFDIFQEDGGTMKVRLVVERKGIVAILVGTHHYIPSPDIKCESVNAMWYSLNYYKRYDSFMLKILMGDEFAHDGNVMCEKNFYPYKTKISIKKRLDKINITDKLILSSLEKFLKPDYGNKFDSQFTFKDSSLDVNTIKAIIKDITIKKANLITYNNIAYYLQKANANKEAIYLLEKILEKYPNRTVAHYNLADAYWAIDDKKKAKEHYNIYIKQMKAKGKAKRIPKVVKLRALSQEK